MLALRLEGLDILFGYIERTARDVDARFILASMMLMPQMLEMVTTHN